MSDRLTRDAWITHGFEVLKNKGHEVLKADTMSKALGVSRGSFYWHFPSLGDFHAALLSAWRQQNTETVIAGLKELPEPREQLAELIHQAKNTPQKLENAMRRWGGANSNVACAMEEADQLRLSYLTQLMMSMGLSEQTAKDRAILLTWAFIGRSFAPDFTKQTSDTLARDLSALLLSKSP